MRRTRNLILTIVSVFLLAGLAGAGATTAFQAQPTAVAVVDVQQVFNTIKERTQMRAELQDRAQKLEQQEKSRRQKIEQLRQQLNAQAPGTAAYKDTQDKLRKSAIERQVWVKFQQRQLNLERGLLVEKLYRRVLDTVGKIASERGFDLVLYKSGDPDFQYQKPEQLLSQIAVRKVLYAEDGTDITDQVVQRLNNEFEAGAGPNGSN